jgi:hypothetical protein
VLFQLLANLVGDTKTGFGQNYPHKIAFLNRTGRKNGGRYQTQTKRQSLIRSMLSAV